MLIMTFHQTFLKQHMSGGLIHEEAGLEQGEWIDIDGQFTNQPISEGSLAGFTMIAGNQGVHFLKDGKFLSAEPGSGRVSEDREQPSFHETFALVPPEKLGLAALFRDPDAECQRLARQVEILNQSGAPVKVHVGCGFTCYPGFVNLDKDRLAPAFSVSNTDEYFIFPYAEMSWGVPSNSVDYVYHEDFIEHIDQLCQVQFLAEVLRVMKPGAVHRINTPSFVAAHRRYSRFEEGFAGVYTGERRYGHIALLSHASLKEIADMVGYRDVVFTTKSHGISPYAIPDTRPFNDRDDVVGNIYADLLK